MPHILFWHQALPPNIQRDTAWGDQPTCATQKSTGKVSQQILASCQTLNQMLYVGANALKCHRKFRRKTLPLLLNRDIYTVSWKSDCRILKHYFKNQTEVSFLEE